MKSATGPGALRLLTRAEMLGLAQALRAGALRLPTSVAALRHHIREEIAQEVAAALHELVAGGGNALPIWLELLAAERQSVQLAHDEVQLVWTGPGPEASTSRDTWVVVTDLFRGAEEEITLVSYALHDGKELLGELTHRMRERPSLRVRMFLHIGRKWGDTTTSESELLRRFAERFRKEQWPADLPLPEVRYDPRTIAIDLEKRPSLHAKVIVVDRARALITSANLTEAAQRRNIEAGVVVENHHLAAAVLGQLDALVEAGRLPLVPGLRS